MCRAIWLTVQNEARLLLKDPIVLFMLLLAPVVIITVAGYSLGNLYGGGPRTFRVPVVDRDHGPAAAGIIEALRQERTVSLELVDDLVHARRLAGARDRTPLAIEIPAGTSDAVAAGRSARLMLYVDPVRRIEVNALELRIDELCGKVSAAARVAAQERLAHADAKLRAQLKQLSTAINRERAHIQHDLKHRQPAVIAAVRAQVDAEIERAARDTQVTIRMREQQAWENLQSQFSERQSILLKVQRYLDELQVSQQAFGVWLEKLKEKAGSRASEIPPPPAFPVGPSEADLAALARPLTTPSVDRSFPNPSVPRALSLKIPEVLPSGDGTLMRDLARLRTIRAPTLPGNLGTVEQSAIPGGNLAVNAFDQYVPGFGVTFLLIGMLLGISLTLFDEREWGTLKRLQVSGVPLAALLLGKLSARFVVGTVQMALLFVVGWVVFGISLGRHPIALVLPIVGISFAAAAFGLVIAALARAHDSVMPLGTVSSMAMSAIGGCWWPLDFEPGWLRAVARWLPTTWAMQGFNDLMIRNRPASSVAWPFAATMGIGLVFLAFGIFAFVKLEKA
jgi:ABC-type multidrug transport system permease subunit